MDFFPAEIPQFNIDGKTSISTSIGLFFSTTMVVIFVAIFASQFLKLFSWEDSAFYSVQEDFSLDLTAFNFSIAFSVDGKDDPNFVEWVVMINGDDTQLVGVHVCSEAELASFFPIV